MDKANDLKKFQNLLDKPESLYEHLSQTDPNIIDKTDFLEQYNEYDRKPYSMRKMIKEILDKGEDSYPTFSNEEAIEISVKLLNEIGSKKEERLKKEKAGERAAKTWLAPIATWWKS